MIAFSFACLTGCVCRYETQLHASFTYVEQLLRYAHTRIVNRIKVYIERSNKQVELIRLRTIISTLLTLETLKWKYSSTCHERTPSGPGKSVRILQVAARHRDGRTGGGRQI